PKPRQKDKPTQTTPPQKQHHLNWHIQKLHKEKINNQPLNPTGQKRGPVKSEDLNQYAQTTYCYLQ
ncbi:hypothetical protein, partial [Corynebacterium sp. HMSC05E07]|uniref:hypothetical protein n=1 Tax=Corynebacterium sp. HMSC05E07 TaxID=1581117 RepID=UPI001AEFF025